MAAPTSIGCLRKGRLMLALLVLCLTSTVVLSTAHTRESSSTISYSGNGGLDDEGGMSDDEDSDAVGDDVDVNDKGADSGAGDTGNDDGDGNTDCDDKGIGNVTDVYGDDVGNGNVTDVYGDDVGNGNVTDVYSDDADQDGEVFVTGEVGTGGNAPDGTRTGGGESPAAGKMVLLVTMLLAAADVTVPAGW